MTKESAIYVIVRIDVEHNIDDNIKDIEEDVVSEMDYDFQYNENGIKIVNTEICGISN